MNVPPFAYPVTNGWTPVYSQLLVIVNKVAMNIQVQVFVEVYIFLYSVSCILPFSIEAICLGDVSILVNEKLTHSFWSYIGFLGVNLILTTTP